MGRLEDPLIARVASQLRDRLQHAADPGDAALARTALAELFRLTTTA